MQLKFKEYGERNAYDKWTVNISCKHNRITISSIVCDKLKITSGTPVAIVPDSENPEDYYLVPNHPMGIRCRLRIINEKRKPIGYINCKELIDDIGKTFALSESKSEILIVSDEPISIKHENKDYWAYPIITRKMTKAKKYILNK